MWRWSHSAWMSLTLKEQTVAEQFELVTKARLCFSCLRQGHMSRKNCDINGCQRFHHSFQWKVKPSAKSKTLLKTLAGVITQGWPDSKLRLPPEGQDYFPFPRRACTSKCYFQGRPRRDTISNESWSQKKATRQSSGSTGMPETSKRSFLLAWHVQRNRRICLQVWSLQYIPPRAAEGALDLTPSIIKTMAGPRCWPLWAPAPGLPCRYRLLLKQLWGRQACYKDIERSNWKAQASYGQTWNSGQDSKWQWPSVQVTGV